MTWARLPKNVRQVIEIIKRPSHSDQSLDLRGLLFYQFNDPVEPGEEVSELNACFEISHSEEVVAGIVRTTRELKYVERGNVRPVWVERRRRRRVVWQRTVARVYKTLASA